MRKLPFCRLPAVSALFVSVSLLQACSVDVDTREDAVAPIARQGCGGRDV